MTAAPASNEVQALVAAVAGLRRFTRDGVEALVGAPLEHAPDADANLRYYSAELSQGPFARVEYREPNQEQNQTWRLLVLQVRPGTRLPLDQFRNGVIPVETPPAFDPRVPPEGTVTFEVGRPGLCTRFQFGARTSTLQLIAFHQEVAHVVRQAV